MQNSFKISDEYFFQCYFIYLLRVIVLILQGRIKKNQMIWNVLDYFEIKFLQHNSPSECKKNCITFYTKNITKIYNNIIYNKKRYILNLKNLWNFSSDCSSRNILIIFKTYIIQWVTLRKITLQKYFWPVSEEPFYVIF